MNSIVNGFAAQVTIGSHVSIAQNVNIMADSGPNASPQLQKIFPIQKASVTIGNHCWLGASVIIMPAVQLGDYCIVAANSYVNTSFAPYSIIGGTPAKLIRSLTQTEINVLINNDKVS
jgi:acetyltransferase-like isoleucine patch superfamily enzyme